MNLVVRLRREVADPPAVAELPAAVRPAAELPAEALPLPARKAHANARRRRDPLGEGHAETWRMLVVKVAASVVVSCRRIVVRISGSWPYRDYLERIGRHVRDRPAVAHAWTG